MMFCSYCGKQLNDGEECTCAGAMEEKSAKVHAAEKKPQVNVKKLAIVAAIVLVALIAVISLISYAGSTINLADYIVIKEVTGLNGQGVLVYDLDEDALTMALWGKKNNEDLTDDNFEAVMLENLEKYEEISNAISCITMTADKETGLSNGDTVTVTASFKNTSNYTFSYHFKDGSKTYTVSGLAEGKTVDPFADECVSVVFSGINGYGEASLEILSEEEPASTFYYELSNTEDLSNGDTVTLTVEVDEGDLTELGYFIPETLEKTYTVSGLEEGKTIDPFAEEFVSVSFSGISNQGEAILEILSEEDPISLFYYDLSQMDELSNGDTVTLTAYVDEDDLLALGYLMPEVLEKTYTVDGLGEYFDITDGFPAEELGSLCDQVMTLTAGEEQDEADSNFTVTVPSVIHSAYFLKANDPVEPYVDLWHGYSFDNAVLFVTSYTIDMGGFIREQWDVWVFPNYFVDAEGNLAFEEENNHSHYFQDASLEEIEEWFSEEYSMMSITELDISHIEMAA